MSLLVQLALTAALCAHTAPVKGSFMIAHLLIDVKKLMQLELVQYQHESECAQSSYEVCK